MPVVINGWTYYGMTHGCRTVGIPRDDSSRGPKEETTSHIECRHCPGLRLSASAHVAAIRINTNHVYGIGKRD